MVLKIYLYYGDKSPKISLNHNWLDTADKLEKNFYQEILH